MIWTTACKDWQARILARQPLVPPPLFPAEAQRGLDVFKALRICDVPGKPTIGEAGREWIFDFIRAIFGAYDPTEERQLIREYFLCVAKKNSKSTLAAGVMITALVLNPRYSAEFLILAPTKEIADNSFDPAADMADEINRENDAEGLGPMFRIYRRDRRIVHLVTKAELKVIAAETDTVTGVKATVVLVDEMWLFGKKPNAMSMLREATGGLASRPEGFVVYLSTMADGPPQGEWKAKLERARKVRDGEVEDPRFLPVIYEFPPSMVASKAYEAPENWYVTNPNLGASVDPQFVAAKLNEAKQASEADLVDFCAKHLNVQIASFLTSDVWAGAAVWRRGEGGPRTLDELMDRCECVTVGVDGGGLDDLFGFAVLGRERETRRWLAWAHALIGPEGFDRRKANITIYRDFIADGDLTLVDGLPDDLAWIVDRVGLLKDASLLAMVGADPAGIGGLVDALAEIGVTEDAKLLTGVPQGIRLMNASKTVERKLVDGTLKHSGSNLLSWCAANAKIRATSTAVMIERAASGYGKIDPLMALFNAAHLMGFNPEASGGRSFWDTEEFEEA